MGVPALVRPLLPCLDPPEKFFEVADLILRVQDARMQTYADSEYDLYFQIVLPRYSELHHYFDLHPL